MTLVPESFIKNADISFVKLIIIIGILYPPGGLREAQTTFSANRVCSQFFLPKSLCLLPSPWGGWAGLWRGRRHKDFTGTTRYAINGWNIP
jgi:hypothetical protein